METNDIFNIIPKNIREKLIFGFTKKVPNLNFTTDKENSIQILAPYFDQYLKKYKKKLALVNQIHSNKITHLNTEINTKNFSHAYKSVQNSKADGIITNKKNTLGILVADCCAVYIWDNNYTTIALLHSGKKGTEKKITAIAIQNIIQKFNINPKNISVFISPCIRPPYYEYDIPKNIKNTALQNNILEKNLYDCNINTATNKQYYSYRKEKGKTGRMLAYIAYKS